MGGRKRESEGSNYFIYLQFNIWWKKFRRYWILLLLYWYYKYQPLISQLSSITQLRERESKFGLLGWVIFLSSYLWYSIWFDLFCNHYLITIWCVCIIWLMLQFDRIAYRYWSEIWSNGIKRRPSNNCEATSKSISIAKFQVFSGDFRFSFTFHFFLCPSG